MATSTALAKRPSDTDLMPPPPPPKRIKRPPKVLDEDTYTSALSHIIARDFFPGLLESETQQEYLDALDAGDTDWIEEAGQRVRAAMTPVRRGRRGVSMTPLRKDGLGSETPRDWRGETPQSSRTEATPSLFDDENAHSKRQEEQHVDLNLGLTAFQAKYTSEDNESFNKVLDRQNAKRTEKYRWMWNGNKIPSARQIAQAARQQKLLQRSPSSSTYDPALFQSLTLAPRPSQDQDLRPAMISHPLVAAPRNNLMFTPDDLSETHPNHISTAQAAASASIAPPKSVHYLNTRLPVTALADSDPDAIPPSPSLSAIDAAIAGYPRPRTSSSTITSLTPGDETPRVNGYAFVDAEPTPSELGLPPPLPSSPPPDDLLQQLITSGGKAGGGVNPFTIHASSRRESLHHRMVEATMAGKRKAPRAAQLRRDEEGVAASGRTPTPRFASSPRVTRTVAGVAARVESRLGGAGTGGGEGRAGLTPAARLLYDKLGKTPVHVDSGGAFEAGRRREGQRKGGWTPTPLRVKRQG